MNPTNLKIEIKARHKAGIDRAILVEGPPGGGKTEIPQQCAVEEKEDSITVHSPLMQPEDYGFPIVNKEKGTVEFAVSLDKFPVEGSPCGERGFLIFDEVSQCNEEVQKIIANIAQAREIHGKKIKKGWTIVMTGNRVTDRAGAKRLLGHLGNRVTRLSLEVSVDDWTQWALANNIKSEVIAFIRFRPELLQAYDPQQEINPTPRSWSQGVSASLGVTQPQNEFEMFKGDVGEAAAAEFTGFLKICRDLPSPDAILLNPTTAPVPDSASARYAIVLALAAKTSPSNFGMVMSYATRLPKELTLLFVKDAVRRNGDVQTCPDFIKWAAGPGAKLLG